MSAVYRLDIIAYTCQYFVTRVVVTCAEDSLMWQ